MSYLFITNKSFPIRNCSSTLVPEHFNNIWKSSPSQPDTERPPCSNWSWTNDPSITYLQCFGELKNMAYSRGKSIPASEKYACDLIQSTFLVSRVNCLNAKFQVPRKQHAFTVDWHSEGTGKDLIKMSFSLTPHMLKDKTLWYLHKHKDRPGDKDSLAVERKVKSPGYLRSTAECKNVLSRQSLLKVNDCEIHITGSWYGIKPMLFLQSGHKHCKECMTPLHVYTHANTRACAHTLYTSIQIYTHTNIHE
jgi:hypothetical protein